MSLEENKAIVRRFVEAYNKKNLDLFDELFAPDYVDHTLHIRGLESLKQTKLGSFLQGIPRYSLDR